MWPTWNQTPPKAHPHIVTSVVFWVFKVNFYFYLYTDQWTEEEAGLLGREQPPNLHHGHARFCVPVWGRGLSWETEARHPGGLDRASQAWAQSQLCCGCLLQGGVACQWAKGTQSASPTQAAQHSGLPVLPPTPVWAAGQGDLLLPQVHWIQGGYSLSGPVSIDLNWCNHIKVMWNWWKYVELMQNWYCLLKLMQNSCTSVKLM